MGVMGLTVPNKSSRKLTNVTQPNWTSTWPPPPRFSPLMECHQTIISPPLGPVQEQPKFPSTKKALYDRSFPRTSPIRKKRQSRLYIKLEVFDHTNYSSKADSWGSHNNSGSDDSSPTGFVVRTKQTRPLVFWCSGVPLTEGKVGTNPVPRQRYHQWRHYFVLSDNSSRYAIYCMPSCQPPLHFSLA
jgi:hypothetical protein